jgi:microcystin-dependent protein
MNGVLSKSANYPIVVADRGKLIDYTAAPFTMTLPLAASAGDGYVQPVRNSAASGNVTIARNGANIDGAAADIAAAPGENFFLVCDGAGWRTIGKQTPGTPTGMVAYFAATSAPTGWFKANGAEISRTAYVALDAILGTTFGAYTNGSGGAGTTHFRLPDLRGEFLRSLDDGRAVDTGRVIGSYQADVFKSHSHSYPTGGIADGAIFNLAQAAPVFSAYTASVGSTGDLTETRPRNIALLACVKY